MSSAEPGHARVGLGHRVEGLTRPGLVTEVDEGRGVDTGQRGRGAGVVPTGAGEQDGDGPDGGEHHAGHERRGGRHQEKETGEDRPGDEGDLETGGVERDQPGEPAHRSARPSSARRR